MSNQIWSLFGVVQIFFAIVIGLYFLNLLRGQRSSKQTVHVHSEQEQKKLEDLSRIHLT